MTGPAEAARRTEDAARNKLSAQQKLQRDRAITEAAKKAAEEAAVAQKAVEAKGEVEAAAAKEAQRLADEARRHQKPAAVIAIQTEGGTVRATRKGIEIAREMADVLSRAERTLCDVSSLVLSVKCGGSD